MSASTISNPSRTAPDAIRAESAAIEARALGFSYGERAALIDVTFSIARGEIFGFLGPNGGGKTTLFKLLSTLAPIQAGSARLFGHDLAGETGAVRRRLGVVFQHPSLDGKLTVGENLAAHGHLYGISGGRLRERSAAMLERLGLSARERDRVETLSGGLQRRVELAKALLHEPELLLLDEPSTGLDPAARREFWNYLEHLREREGVTVVLTTHYMDEAERCSHVGYIHMSKLVVCGEPDELKEMPLVNPTDAKRLDVTCDHVTIGLQAVRRMPGVRTATVFGQSMHLLVDKQMAEGDILSELKKAGIPKADIRPIAPSLEDVFVALTTNNNHKR
jgi:ABC-type multidrug transport system ATPase subunit